VSMSKKYYIYTPTPNLESLYVDVQVIIREIANQEAKNKIQLQQERHRHNYHTRAFNTVQQNMLRNRMNQRTKHK
jgi:hypothetical protein